jgi:Spy/CpxP family protein refolding chaperone
MNKTKLLSVAVICLVLINLGTLAIMLFREKPPRPDHSFRGEGPRKIIIERLHFDEEQQKQYEIIIKEHQTKTQELNKRSRELHDELYSLLIENTIDKTKSNIIIQNIAENQKAIDNLNFDHFQKIKAICKNEQIENFNGLVLDLTHLFGPPGRP